MKLNMNKYIKIALFFLVLVLVAILADLLATQHFTSHTPLFDPHQVPPDRISIGDLELFYKFKTMLSTINATLLVLLLGTYIDIYRKFKSEFTLGLILFSLILLLYAVSSNPILQQFLGYWGTGLGPFAMLPDLFTSFALVVLLYLTMK
ncbi:MAG: hypothetical protein JW815_02700 [Candidatus Bathyarchaeota archaeon]|nr:hypothetical protein [Candidatus Bathyarchaeum sp.]